MSDSTYEEVADTELRVGDVVKLWCGRSTIVRIAPYRGPLAGCTGIAECEPGLDFSLWTGQHTHRLARGQ